MGKPNKSQEAVSKDTLRYLRRKNVRNGIFFAKNIPAILIRREKYIRVNIKCAFRVTEFCGEITADK